jgi:septal ring factor EnvC (AmiA/AmiB activator)
MRFGSPKDWILFHRIEPGYFRRSCAFDLGKIGLVVEVRRGTTMLAIALTLLAAPRFGIAAEERDARDLVQFRQEIDALKGSEAAARKRVEQDEKHIQYLEDELKRLETQNQKLGKTTNTLEINV